MTKPKNIRPIRIEGDVAYVPLTKGYEAIIDAADVHLVEGFNWSACTSLRNDRTIRTVYAIRTRSIRGRRQTISMHRVIAGTSVGIQTDHKDCNGLNNRRVNLRDATPTQNQHNARTPTHNSSGVKGVYWNKILKRWVARVNLGKKRKHLGYFASIEDAAAAYADAIEKMHGEYGRVA